MLHDHAVLTQQQQPSGVTALAVVPDHNGDAVMITACQDNALKLWAMPNFSKRGIIAQRQGRSDVVRCIAKGPGNSFFTGSMDHSILVWEFCSK